MASWTPEELQALSTGSTGDVLPGAPAAATAPVSDPGNGFPNVADKPDDSITGTTGTAKADVKPTDDYYTKPVGDAGVWQLPGGTKVRFDKAPSHADLDHAQTNLEPVETQEQPNDLITKGLNWVRDKYGLGPIGQSDPNDWSQRVSSGAATAIKRDIAETDHALTYALPTLDGDRSAALKAADQKLDSDLNQNPQTVDDTASAVGNTIGHAATGALSYAAGGLPLLAAEGAAQGEANAGHESGYKSGPMALGGALGAATAAMPVPFMGASKGALVRPLLKAALGGSVTGGAATAGQDWVSNYAKNNDLNPLDADYSNVPEGMALGAAVGAPFGPLAAAGAKGAEADAAAANAAKPHDVLNPEEAIPAAKGQVAAKLQAQDAAGNKLNSPATAMVARDNVYTGLRNEINALQDQLKEQLSPSQGKSLDDVLDRAGLNSTLQNAKNKVQGNATEDDIKDLGDAVGHMQEGRALISAVRQANVMSDLSRGGVTGGLSRLTDHAIPFMGDNSGLAGMLGRPASMLEAYGMLMHPGIAIPAAATFGAGRAIDALTGNRWPLQKFVGDNLGQARPVDMSGADSIMAQRAMAQQQADSAAFGQKQDSIQSQNDWNGMLNEQKEQAAQAAQADAQADQQRRLAVNQAQTDAENEAKQQQADTQFGQKQDSIAAQHDFNGMQAAEAKAVKQDSLEGQHAWDSGAKAQRQNSWAVRAAKAPAQAATAAAQAETALQHSAVARNDPGHPQSFNGQVYARTGMKPAEALTAVKQMADAGEIPMAVHDAWRDNPSTLMKGNIGNKVIDRLSQTVAPKANVEASTPKILNPIAYKAQADGNQARVTAADTHILGRTDMSDQTKSIISEGINGIGGVKNKMSASAILDRTLGQLNGKDQEVAHAVMSPLVTQIRHDTPADHVAEVSKAPETVVATKEVADKLANGETSHVDDDVADAIKRFEQKGTRDGRMSKSDAHVYALKMTDAWIKSGKQQAWLP